MKKMEIGDLIRDVLGDELEIVSGYDSKLMEEVKQHFDKITPNAAVQVGTSKPASSNKKGGPV